MLSAYEITHDGPYLRIVLSDHLSPEWATLDREVAFECDEPVTRAIVVSPHVRTDSDALELQNLVQLLERSGADVFLEWRSGLVTA